MRTAFAAAIVSMLLASCGGSEPPPAAPAGPAPSASASAAPKVDEAAQKAAALEKLTSGEAKSGTCDEGHKRALEKLLADVEGAVAAKKGDDGKPLEVVAKRVVALGASPKMVELSVSGRATELHVLAFGVRDVSMDVLVGSAAASTRRSPLAESAPKALDVPNVGTADLQRDSRWTEIAPAQPLVVRLSGEGCAAMVTFLKR